MLAVLSGTPTGIVIDNLSNRDFGRHAWVVQEKAKGNVATLFGLVGLTGTDYGGWGFNFNDALLATYPNWYVYVPNPSPGYRRIQTPGEIQARTDNWLEGCKYSPLFNTGWGTYDYHYPGAPVIAAFPTGGPSWIMDLYNPSKGSETAANQVTRVQLLSQAIPALSTPVGQRPLLSLQPSQRNYDMPGMFISQGHWPRDFDQNSPSLRMWWHSDIRDVAYLYCFGVFDAINQISNQ